MSTYTGVWKTNDFDVKDLTNFQQWVGRWPDAGMITLRGGKVQLFKAEGSAWGGIPDQQYSEQEGWKENTDFLQELQAHVQEGCVCVLRVVGHEGLKYLDGHAHAIRGGDGDPDTHIVHLYLEDIDKMAKKAFALPVAPI